VEGKGLRNERGRSKGKAGSGTGENEVIAYV